MLKKLIRSGLIFAGAFCAVLITSCISPLFSDPLESKDLPDEMFDEKVHASLLKTGAMFDYDEKFIIEFSEDKYPELQDYSEKKKNNVDRYTLYGLLTYFQPEGPRGESLWETELPVLLVPFRVDGKLFFRMTLDYFYFIMEKDIAFNFLFMMHPYSYILQAEEVEDGWEVKIVEFASLDLGFGSGRSMQVVKHSDKVELHDGIVMNEPEDLLEMLKDTKNYKLNGSYKLRPVPEGRLDELKAALREEAAEKAGKSGKNKESEEESREDSKEDSKD